MTAPPVGLFLDLLLVETAQDFFVPGRGRRAGWTDGGLALVVKVRALRLGGRVTCAGTVVERDTVKHVVLSERDLDDVHALLQATGLPGRAPDVTGRTDTSDVFTHLLLRATTEAGSQDLELSLMATGCEGPDAEALRALVSRMCALLGVVAPPHL